MIKIIKTLWEKYLERERMLNEFLSEVNRQREAEEREYYMWKSIVRTE